MKKFLSLLSVLTISGTAMPLLIAASPSTYQMKQELLNKKNNHSFELSSAVIPHSYDSYEYDSYDLTEIFGFTNWNDFNSTYNSIKISNVNINFHRHDNNGKIEKNIFINFNFDGFSDHNRNVEEERETVVWGGNPTKALTPIKSMTTMKDAFHKGASLLAGRTNYSTLFDESINYKLTRHSAKVKFSVIKYIKNNHLMLGVLYLAELYSVGGIVSSTLEIKQDSSIEFYKS
ncbi:hypothetical protein [Spiroplasma endosymbiont of Dilophus febrilis]|uniref:hypothetical protein n=1 Tax=Spiroplasma endosymbiont of Dilophus febrilis TaxID=3066292 RepID=UPI00313CC96C